LELSQLLKWSWNNSGNNWKMLTSHKFSSSNLLHRDGSISFPFPSARAVEMIYSLAENFKMRIKDFRSQATKYVRFRTHSSLNPVMLQKNCNWNWVNCSMTQFYVVVSTRRFNYRLHYFTGISVLLARYLPRVFGSTCTYETKQM
jgi:hypothetical protein